MMRTSAKVRAQARLYVAVGTGSAIGSLLRFMSGAVAVSGLGLSALWATGFVNVLGSFIIMFFAVLTGSDGRLFVSSVVRQFVMGGLCGGFTTFSAMSLDAFVLVRDGNPWLAGAYLVAVVGLSLLAAWIGYVVATWINR